MLIRLLIVDAHTLTRYGLREVIARQDDIEIVAESDSAAGAPGLIAAVQPDVVTMDASLPDGDGMKLACELRDRHPQLGIVMLTSRDEDHLLFQALDAGVSAFVSKAAPVDEVLAAIRHAAVAATSFTASGLAVALNRRRTLRDGLSLSPREAEVLRLLRDGLTIPVIAQVMHISTSTAKTYVARLYEKLGATNRAQALMTAVHHSLIGYEERPVPQLTPSRDRRAALSVVQGPRQAASLGRAAGPGQVAARGQAAGLRSRRGGGAQAA